MYELHLSLNYPAVYKVEVIAHRYHFSWCTDTVTVYWYCQITCYLSNHTFDATPNLFKYGRTSYEKIQVRVLIIYSK